MPSPFSGLMCVWLGIGLCLHIVRKVVTQDTLEIDRKWSLFQAYGYYLCTVVLMEDDPISHAYSCFKK
jgi:hypothetical protein